MITVQRNEKTIKVLSPYHPNLPSGAKKIGGKFSAADKGWSFDIRDEERVKNLYMNVYGMWDTPTTELVNVRIKVVRDWIEEQSGIFIFGKLIARAFDRDSGAKLGDGVILVNGHAYSGGSRKNWETIIKKDSVIEIKDIPKNLYDTASIPSAVEVEIIENFIDKDALLLEKENLLKRVAEIDKILGNTN